MQTPPLLTGLTVLTSLSNPQNSSPSTSILVYQIPFFFSLSLSTFNPSGAMQWLMDCPAERGSGRSSSTFLELFRAKIVIGRDELVHDWQRFEKRESWGEEICYGQSKYRRNVQNCQCEETILRSVSAAVSTFSCSSFPWRSAHSYFSPVSSIPPHYLTLLSAVSKIDWGPQCFLVHVGSIAKMFPLSICLRCQGVSWVPACLLLNIYHLLNTVAVPHSHPQRLGLPSTHRDHSVSFFLVFLCSLLCRYCCLFMFSYFVFSPCLRLFIVKSFNVCVKFGFSVFLYLSYTFIM